MDVTNRPTPVKLYSTCYEPQCIEEKSPIIFIHGVLSSPVSWYKVRNKICDKTGRKGYAISLRNHGGSDWSDEMSVIHMAEDVKNFMMKECISRAILIGHSLGGRVALAIALGNPEMIEKIIIEDQALSIEDTECKFIEYRSILESAASSLKGCLSSLPEDVAREKINPPFMHYWSEKPIGKVSSEDKPPYLPFSKIRLGEFVWDINVDVVAEFFGTIPKFEIPLRDDTVFLGEALFIAAEYSVFRVLDQKELIKKHFPNAQFVCVEDVHHCCHQEKPEKFVDVVTNFLVC